MLDGEEEEDAGLRHERRGEAIAMVARVGSLAVGWDWGRCREGKAALLQRVAPEATMQRVGGW